MAAAEPEGWNGLWDVRDWAGRCNRGLHACIMPACLHACMPACLHAYRKCTTRYHPACRRLEAVVLPFYTYTNDVFDVAPTNHLEVAVVLVQV